MHVLTAVVIVSHSVIDKAVEVGISPPVPLIAGAAAICTTYVVKKIHRNHRNKNNRRRRKQKVSLDTMVAVASMFCLMTSCCMQFCCPDVCYRCRTSSVFRVMLKHQPVRCILLASLLDPPLQSARSLLPALPHLLSLLWLSLLTVASTATLPLQSQPPGP